MYTYPFNKPLDEIWLMVIRIFMLNLIINMLLVIWLARLLF